MKTWWWQRRRGQGPPAAPPASAPRPALPDALLLVRAEEFNRAAEVYWRDLRGEPSGRVHALNKPFGNVADAPAAVYRLGLVLAELHLGVGHTVLDFGAGSCWLSSCLNRLGCRTIAVDVSPTALDLGRELFEMDRRHRPELEPRFLPYDGHRLPLPDQSVDRVVCFDAFHHVPNLDEVMAEVFRVLRPGGRAVLAEPGEGHSHAGHSLFDSERCGVLENELTVPDLERRARAAGFTDVRLKPYPDPGAISLGASEYVRLVEGDAGVFPMPVLQESLRQFLLFTLLKGEETVDSRNPRLLRAEIRRADGSGEICGRGGAIVAVPFTVRNTGDTLWRHEIDEIGGYVVLAGHLLAEDGRPLTQGFFRAPLPASVPPGGCVEVLADVPLPAELGNYLVRVDLVDERVTWFGQAGSPTLDLKLSVEAYGPDLDSAALRAELSASLPREGLRAAGDTRVAFPVRLHNRGRSEWPHSPGPRSGAVSLAGHLLGKGEEIRRDFLHLPLPQTVGPGESVEMTCSFRAPLEPGSYRLKLDLVMELVCWFEQRGSPPLELPLVVTDEVPTSADPGLLRATLELRDPPPTPSRPGAHLTQRVRVKNIGNTRWLAGPPGRPGHVCLGAHLLGSDRAVKVVDFLRVALPQDVAPNEGVELIVPIETPAESGRYLVELDLVDEGIAWFGPSGSPTALIPLKVEA